MLWVTGANGLVGSTLKEIAKDVIATGHEIDISDYGALLDFVQKNPGIDAIVNCAAFSLVDASEYVRKEAHEVNALGPENLAKIACEINAHFTHISTDYVFPGTVERPLTEKDQTGPCNYYGETKLEGERRVRGANSRALIVRTAWVFGNGGKNFIAKLIQMLESDEEIRLTNDHFGSPTYALDLAKAILAMKGKSGLYHFVNREIATKFSFGCFIRDEMEKLGCPVIAKKVISVPGSSFPSPTKRPLYSALDPSKIENELNTSIRSWKEALKEYLCTLYDPARTS